MRIAVLFLMVTAAVMAEETSSYDRALNLYHRTEYAAAITALKQAPEDARTLQLLGQCYFMDAEYHKATDVLEKAGTLDPRTSMIFTWLGRAYGRRAETTFGLGAIGLASKSRQALEKA